MAIIQISRIIQRSGNLVDLPQLAQAEFGWASDSKRLFIGNEIGNTGPENVEVLTSYSTISFGQIDGSYGNISLTAPVIGQIITYDANSNVWVNTGGNALNPGNTAQYSNNLVHLGDITNVKLGGGSLGYVLETDGKGNLSWSSKGTLRNQIYALSNSTPIIMTVANTTPYTNGLEITISGAIAANAGNVVNGRSFYVKLANDFPSTGNVSLFTDSGLNVATNGSTLGTYTANSGVATAILGSSGGGVGTPDGIDTSLQYKVSDGVFGGSDSLTWSGSSLNITGNMSLSGTGTVGAIAASSTVRGSQLESTVATGTSPLVVASSTRIANANVQTAGNLINGTSNVIVNNNGNIVVGVAGNANVITVASDTVTIPGNANIGNLRSSTLSTTGNATVGNLSANNVSANTLSVSGNANVGNIAGGTAVFTNFVGNGALLTNVVATNIAGQISNALTAGTVYINAQPNITSVGTLSSVSVSGNANVGNIRATNGIFTTVNATTIGNTGASIIGNGAGLTSVPAANLSGQVNLTSQVSGALPITSGGTGQTTATNALNALLPSQAGKSGNMLSTNGVNPVWVAGATEAWVKNLINTIEPLGTIKAWGGSLANIPTGWALCNGQNGTLNLTDRFIVASGGGTFSQNSTGGHTAGSTTTPITGSTGVAGQHAHGFSTAGSFLTIDQIPGHSHVFRNIRYSEWIDGQTTEWIDPVYGYQNLIGVGSSRGADIDNGVFWIDSGTFPTGGAGSEWYRNFNGTTGANPHYHGINIDGTHSHTVTGTATVPGYYALAFIQKIALLT